MGESCSFLVLVFRHYAGFFSRISIDRTTDIPPKLSSYPILDVDGSKSASLYTDTLEDILLAKSVALSSCNTYRDIFYLI